MHSNIHIDFAHSKHLFETQRTIHHLLKHIEDRSANKAILSIQQTQCDQTTTKPKREISILTLLNPATHTSNILAGRVEGHVTLAACT